MKCFDSILDFGWRERFLVVFIGFYSILDGHTLRGSSHYVYWLRGKGNGVI